MLPMKSPVFISYVYTYVTAACLAKRYVYTQVQELAWAAVQHTAQCGGRTPTRSLLHRLANLAARGKHASNAERDLHHIVRNIKLQATLETVRVRFLNPATTEVQPVNFSCLFPDVFAQQIWAKGEEYFKYFFLGNQSAESFWNHVERTAWGEAALAGAQDRSRLIPITFYGDEVYTYKNTECGVITVLAWSADYMTAAHGPLDRYFLIAAFSQYLECKETWEDLSAVLAARFRDLVSCTHWPWCSSGYRFAFSSVTGDLKWIKDRFGLHDYMANSFCSYCSCVKRDPLGRVGHTLSDFRESAVHRQRRILHEEFLQSTAAHERALTCMYVVPSFAVYYKVQRGVIRSSLTCVLLL